MIETKRPIEPSTRGFAFWMYQMPTTSAVAKIRCFSTWNREKFWKKNGIICRAPDSVINGELIMPVAHFEAIDRAIGVITPHKKWNQRIRFETSENIASNQETWCWRKEKSLQYYLFGVLLIFGVSAYNASEFPHNLRTCSHQRRPWFECPACCKLRQLQLR